MTITSQQIARIGTLRGILRKRVPHFDESYYDGLRSQFGKDSCKDLTQEQGDHAIAWLQAHEEATRPVIRSLPGIKVKGHGTSVRGETRFEELSTRPAYFATPAQLRKIEFMWAQVSRASPSTRGQALDVFLNNRWKVASLTMLQKSEVPAVIKALEQMKKQKIKNENGDNHASKGKGHVGHTGNSDDRSGAAYARRA